MTWVKLDDQFFRHPKILALTTSARLLYVAGLCYASSQLTDGAIPRSALQLIAIESGAKTGDAKKLVEVGLWETVTDGWMIHNYSEHQRSKDDVDRIREQNRERKAKARERQRHGDVTQESRRDTSVSHARSHGDVTGLETEPETETETEMFKGLAVLARDTDRPATLNEDGFAHWKTAYETRWGQPPGELRCDGMRHAITTACQDPTMTRKLLIGGLNAIVHDKKPPNLLPLLIGDAALHFDELGEETGVA